MWEQRFWTAGVRQRSEIELHGASWRLLGLVFCSFGGLLGFLGLMGGSLEALWELLWASWWPSGSFWQASWRVLWASCGRPSASWGPLGESWGLLGILHGPSWGALGTYIGGIGPFLGPNLAVSGRFRGLSGQEVSPGRDQAEKWPKLNEACEAWNPSPRRANLSVDVLHISWKFLEMSRNLIYMSGWFVHMSRKRSEFPTQILGNVQEFL